MKKQTWFLPLVLLLAVGATACDESLLGDDEAVPTAISIGPEGTLEVAEGATLELTAMDQNANALTSGVSWWTSEESIATVNAIGVVSGVSVGTTTVHARLGELEDSVELKVTFGEVALGEMKVVIGGDIEQRYTLQSGNSGTEVVGVQAEFLDRPEWNFGYVIGETWSSDEFALVLAIPGNLAVGESTMTPLSEPGWESESDLIKMQGGMALMFREDGAEEFIFHTTAGRIEVQSVETPGGTWEAPTGSIRGTATFSADEYRVTWDDAAGRDVFEATGRSVDVAVGFNAPAFLYKGGYMDLTVSGGPYGSGVTVEGWGDAYHYTDGTGSELSLGVEEISGSGVERDLWILLRDPSVGTHQVQSDYSAGPAYMEWVEGSPWSGSGIYAESRSGTLTVDQLQLGTSSEWGLTTGSMDASLEIRNTDEGTNTGEFISVTGTFAIPLEAQSNMTGAMKSDDRSSRLRSVLSGRVQDRPALRR